ncbi:MoxR-like ATPase [Methanosarcina thermophila]|jgi:MoxR-like ATPase|uniref:MoxR-like ATPase n=3 Tax=Methanosarcina thermophila TaxID=2210 RepID=A0A1I6ZAP8_METTE|nr:MoxR family ATPase [Methanosarcina thermophila]ALK06476.1 MAG: ATPase [Methanosarcina sp. 795]AKB11859.1 MoxR-like ATPase in aerotolerance operon [Methanosarcina thermophila TM-1]AKB14946.1 MoxR-like ATPase in aerotolerance operon [Methanosarcina thermophila CHTI-55]NLU57327.1 MoxR family ATPase [Methanosarcina thermophila]SFT59796.1 MoxR-like ATPase [Methanosarcina thermophila]
MDESIQKLNERARYYSEQLSKLRAEIKNRIIGQNDIIDSMLIALISQGHVLLEGVPGLAKTLMSKTMAECLDCDFVRLQFTPDLLPADITGTKVYNHNEASFSTLKGPIFANFVLADEINRAPPKVQSALLEAMQERQVSIQGETFKLERPFFVMATQNPIESEGTYKLPEAQVDRFMFKLIIDYPTKDEEIEIIERFTQDIKPQVSRVLTSRQIIEIQDFNPLIYADRKIKDYVVRIVDATRHPQAYNVDVEGYIEYGASPRASLWLILAAKAHAMLDGRGYVVPEDIKAVAYNVLRHRILLNYEAEVEEVTSDQIITQILNKVKVP